MVADDGLEVIQILELNLRHANLKVSSAQSGGQALRRASQERPNMILLDALLPDLESVETYFERIEDRKLICVE
jgi:two-component system alkaline phosphatase synthesis response regulator PhoP